MAKKTTEVTRADVESVLAMAREWKVDENPLFLAQVESFEMQMETLRMMKDSVKGAYTEKSYISGTKNTYVDPILKEMPRFTEQLNRTIAGMIDTITKLGVRPEQKVKDSLEAFNEKH